MWGIVRNVTKTSMSLSLTSHCLSTRSHQNLCTSYNTKGNECHAYIPPETGEDLGYKQSYCSFPPQKTPGVLFSNLGLWLLVTCSHLKLSCWSPCTSTISSMGTELLCSMTNKRQGGRRLLVLHSSWVRGSICDLLSLGLLTSKPKLSLKLETRWQPDAPSEPNLSG